MVLRDKVSFRYGEEGLEAVYFFDREFIVSGNVNDGPYVHYQASGNLESFWVCEGKVHRKVVKSASPAVIEPLCGYKRKITIRDIVSEFPVSVKFIAHKVAAFSDVHGQYDLMVKLLQANRIIDDNLDWVFADGHVVITGDMFDRGSKVTEVLWLLYHLDAQAQAAGGYLHILLGNHETMVLYHDLRYVNKKYDVVAEKMGKTYTDMFDGNSVLGRWLRSKPVIVQVNDMLFMHGGLHPQYLTLNLRIEAVNEQYRQSLGIAKVLHKEQSVLSFLYGSIGPIWYRGYFNEPLLDEVALDYILAEMAVKRIVVGHTSMQGVFSHYQGRVISIDSSIKEGQSGELMFWDEGRLMRGTLSGERLPIFEMAENL